MGLRKKIIEMNPYNHYLLRKKRNRIKDIEPFTIMASNCIGGLLYHTYRLQFTSPLINTRIDSDEFIRFILNYKEYLREKLHFIDSKQPFPVAKLGDITVNFVHYRTAEDAELKWDERKKRIIDNRLFVILNDCDGVTENEIRLLDDSSLRNIIVLSSKKLLDSRSNFFLPPFEGQPCVGNSIIKNILTGEMMVEKYFDFAAWFRQDKGTDLEEYRKHK